MEPEYWTFVAVALLLLGLNEMRMARRRRMNQIMSRLDALHEGAPNDGPLRGAARWFATRYRKWMPIGQIDQLREQLLWAGQPFGLSAEEFYLGRFGVALLVACAVPLLRLGADSNKSGQMLIGGAIGYLLADRYLQLRIRDRINRIRIDLPHTVHLIATAIEAGLPMVEAVRRVASDSPGLLAAELMRTVQEIATGKPTALAWQHMTRRTNCQELREVATAIIQSQEYGVAVAEQLRFQMRAIRTRKQQEAQERAQAASVQMRLPMIVCILAPTMVILLGPAIVTVLANLRGG